MEVIQQYTTKAKRFGRKPKISFVGCWFLFLTQQSSGIICDRSNVKTAAKYYTTAAVVRFWRPRKDKANCSTYHIYVHVYRLYVRSAVLKFREPRCGQQKLALSLSLSRLGASVNFKLLSTPASLRVSICRVGLQNYHVIELRPRSDSSIADRVHKVLSRG